jgi:carboxylesterase type B
VVTDSFGCRVEYGFIQQSLPERAFTSSELDGLNLNIVVPTIALSGKSLPCFVFIHGGGFTNGGNSWPQYDLTRFVQLSIEQGEPIIAINIKYET